MVLNAGQGPFQGYGAFLGSGFGQPYQLAYVVADGQLLGAQGQQEDIENPHDFLERVANKRRRRGSPDDDGQPRQVDEDHGGGSGKIGRGGENGDAGDDADYGGDVHEAAPLVPVGPTIQFP